MMNEVAAENRTAAIDYGMTTFELVKEISANAVNNRTVYPTGLKTKIINPNAKPFKLNPPK